MWRSQGGNNFQLVGFVEENVASAGAGQVAGSTSDPVNVEQGDILGIFWRNPNPVPFDYNNNCPGNNPTYARNNPGTMTVGGVVNAPVLGVLACRVYSFQVDIGPGKPKLR